MKLFTLMTCTYNNAKILGLALEHMLALDKLEEYVEKVIIVDNASTDTTFDVSMNYKERYPTLISYIYEPKPGVTYARKHAADIETPWFIFVDDDNLLNHDYLTVIAEVIENNMRVGVINCASIAAPVANTVFSTKQKEKLKVAAPALACSHYSFEAFLSGEKPQAEAPFGAGVVLRTSPIKKLAQNGWTKNEGRKKGVLTSGEDGEIISSVLLDGYDYFFTDKTFFLHIIPPHRLEECYLQKLYAGIGHGMYLCNIQQKGEIKTLLYALKNCLKIIYAYFYALLMTNESKKLEWHYKSYTWRAYMQCTIGNIRKVKEKL